MLASLFSNHTFHGQLLCDLSRFGILRGHHPRAIRMSLHIIADYSDSPPLSDTYDQANHAHHSKKRLSSFSSRFYICFFLQPLPISRDSAPSKPPDLPLPSTCQPRRLRHSLVTLRSFFLRFFPLLQSFTCYLYHSGVHPDKVPAQYHLTTEQMVENDHRFQLGQRTG